MTSLRNFEEDSDGVLRKFKKRAEDIGIKHNIALADGNYFPMHVIEWPRKDGEGSDGVEVSSVSALEGRRPEPTIRVLFAWRDVPHPTCVNGLEQLLRSSHIPKAFIAESFQNVSQSFGQQTDEKGTWVWFHVLTKDVAITGDDQPQRIIHRQGNQGIPNMQQEGQQNNGAQRGADIPAEQQSQANLFWIKTGVLLRVENVVGWPPFAQSTTPTNSSTTLALPDSKVILYCFGAPETLKARIQRLAAKATCDEILKDPCILLEIVIEEVHQLLDDAGWSVATIFGPMETRTLGSANDNNASATPGKGIDFTGLHNFAKHTIYLQENCESALATLESLQDFHKSTYDKTPTPAQNATKQALEYRKSLFQSTQRRLASLDKRMANIIQLSFNLVTLTDSRTMQSENQSMKTIAVMTLIFMPLGTVASIFGSQFFAMKDEAPYHIAMSQDFWVLWLVAGPLTFVIVVLWRLWYWEAREKLLGKQPGTGGRHLYRSWKQLKMKGGELRRRQRMPRGGPC